MPRDADIDQLLQEAARVAADWLRALDDPDAPVARWMPPEDLAARFDLSLPQEGRPLEQVLEQARATLDLGVRTGHRRFFNQLFGGHDAAALLGEWMASLANTSAYTYECAPVQTLMELALVRRMAAMVGFPEGEGVIVPGGSLSNLMAALVARHRHFPHVKGKGLQPDDRPVMFASEEAHYSLRRAATVMGLGLEGVVEVPVDSLGRMDPRALSAAVRRAREEGRTPFLVAATSGTTVPGAFDPLPAVADVCEGHGLWLHVDASFGGTVLFSGRHRHLLAGIERAHSVTWNPHKMMGVPLSCSATLLREKGLLLDAFGMNADYLFHGESGGWDLGDLTLQCGRRVDALKLWLSWQAHGDRGYERRVDRLFALATRFAELVGSRPGFRLVREPQGTNVCFRHLPAHWAGLLTGGYQPASPGSGSSAGGGSGGRVDARAALEGQAAVAIRQALVEGGRFLLNYATLDGAPTLRFVASNPVTSESDLVALLDEIERLGAGLPAPPRARATASPGAAALPARQMPAQGG